jgi:hypothetical protein
MKTFVMTMILGLITATGFAQTTSPDQTTQTTEVTMAELQLVPFRMPSLTDVGGSPFLHQEYKNGFVQFNGGRYVTNVPVRFNTFNNIIMVQRDGDELKLESFEFVSYEEAGSNGNMKKYMFRQGYPEIDNRPATAVYQVLAYGPKLHLVKFISQKVEDAATLGDYSRREIVTTQQLYTYIPGGDMKKIKAGKQGIVDAVPALASNIDEIVKSKSLNLKSESDLAELVDALNKL